MSAPIRKSKSEILRNIILASSRIEVLTASALANAGHIICARTRSVAADSASVKDILTFAKVNRIDVRPLALDVTNEVSVQSAISRIVTEIGRIDILIHNAGHLVFGPFEAFTPDQIATEYDIHCGTHTPRAGNGLVIWVGSSSTQGATPPYFATAKPGNVASENVDVVGMGFGKRPFRVYIDTDWNEPFIIHPVADRMTEQALKTMRLEDPLTPKQNL
ncbi:MAG: hypothetical protein LQ348_007679 [Seirophora lacunosa]|nr:MAG: hypothetical protein LQ348_007679 [Seirophora lacunosa]